MRFWWNSHFSVFLYFVTTKRIRWCRDRSLRSISCPMLVISTTTGRPGSADGFRDLIPVRDNQDFISGTYRLPMTSVDLFHPQTDRTLGFASFRTSLLPTHTSGLCFAHSWCHLWALLQSRRQRMRKGSLGLSPCPVVYWSALCLIMVGWALACT